MTQPQHAKKHALTAEELYLMEDPLDGTSYEIDHGTLMVREPAGLEHGEVGTELLFRLRAYVKSQHLGTVLGADVGYVLARKPDTVYAPDVSFLRRDRIPYGEAAQKFFEGAPDLSVEVLSPRDRFTMVERKVKNYLKYGTPLVWVIRPRDHIAIVHRADGSITKLSAFDTLDGETVVPGFHCQLGALFIL